MESIWLGKPEMVIGKQTVVLLSGIRELEFSVKVCPCTTNGKRARMSISFFTKRWLDKHKINKLFERIKLINSQIRPYS